MEIRAFSRQVIAPLTIYGFLGLSLVLLGVLGVTAGAHRLWAHQSYKASTRLRVFLMLCQTLVGNVRNFGSVDGNYWPFPFPVDLGPLLLSTDS